MYLVGSVHGVEPKTHNKKAAVRPYLAVESGEPLQLIMEPRRISDRASSVISRYQATGLQCAPVSVSVSASASASAPVSSTLQNESRQDG